MSYESYNYVKSSSNRPFLMNISFDLREFDFFEELYGNSYNRGLWGTLVTFCIIMQIVLVGTLLFLISY